MSAHTPQQLKRALIEAGFEVFRTLRNPGGDEIVLAERPRENLIMDSGVRLKVKDPFEVRVVIRAQKADYPTEEEAHIFERVRKLAAPALVAGFVEVETTVAPVMDPGDPLRALDTFYEILYQKDVDSLEAAITLLRFAVSLEKRS